MRLKSKNLRVEPLDAMVEVEGLSTMIYPKMPQTFLSVNEANLVCFLATRQRFASCFSTFQACRAPILLQRRCFPSIFDQISNREKIAFQDR